MKKRHLISFVLILFASCGGKDTAPISTTPVDSVKKENPKPELAYPIKHIDWKIGDFDNVKRIMEMYKIWDEKKSFVTKDYFADTLRLNIPLERGEFVVPNNEINKTLGENRAMFQSTSNDVLSAVALRDKASGEDWVMVTSYSKWIDTNGKRDSVLYHDDWRLEDGKVNLLISFFKLPPKGFLNKQK